MLKNNIMKTWGSRSGFTLIEVLTVIGIISILVVVAVPSYALMRNNVALTSTVEDLADTLRIAQNYSMTSQDGATWGVHCASDRYSMYKGTWPTAPAKETLLPSGVTMTCGISDITFERLTGSTQNTQITVSLSTGVVRTIQVSASGKISLQ